MESVLFAQTESDGRPAGACRSHSLRPSRPVDQAARFSQPEGPGIFPPGSAAIGSHIHPGMHIADRHCPDENLLRQNCFHLKMNGSIRKEGPAKLAGPSMQTISTWQALPPSGGAALMPAFLDFLDDLRHENVEITGIA